MNAAPNTKNGTPPSNRWQFSLRRMFVATAAVAVLFGVASWGGWIKSDAVIYLAVTVLAAVFSATARRAILGACTILGVFFLADLCRNLVFGPPTGRTGVDPEMIWMFGGLLLGAAVTFRFFTRARALSLVVSLLLVELFVVAIIVYTYGCSTLFEAFDANHSGIYQHFLAWFPEQRWYIVGPWLLGIAIGEIMARARGRGGNHHTHGPEGAGYESPGQRPGEHGNRPVSPERVK